MNIPNLTRVLFLLAGLTMTGTSQTTYKTIGPGSCGTNNTDCHVKENRAMVDQHKYSVDNLMTSENLNSILVRYGVDGSAYLLGTGKCMHCHGTVITDRMREEVEEGVSCESCHGPGSGYKDNHKEAKGKGLAFGLSNLADLDTRARACVDCHYITEQKLINAGHPAGQGFNYLAGMRSVAKHWKRPATDADLKDRQPFESEKGKRGPVKLPAAPPARAGGAQREPRPEPARPLPPPRPVPAGPVVVTEPVDLGDLPPFPAISDTASVDEILLKVKERLDLLNRKTSKKQP